MTVLHLASLGKTVTNYLTLWLARPVLRTTFVQYLIAFYSKPEATNDVISGMVVYSTGMKVHVKFGDSRLNHS